MLGHPISRRFYINNDRHALALALIAIFAISYILPVQAQQPSHAHTIAYTKKTEPCSPQIDSVTAATATSQSQTTPPKTGWQHVTLPDNWDKRLGIFSNPDAIKQPTTTVWYRIGFSFECIQNTPTPSQQQAYAVAVDSMSMAGEVYLNGDLLWRDAQLTEPLSRGHSTPRYWVIPYRALQQHNELLVRVVGVATQSSGLGGVRVGALSDVVAQHHTTLFEKRTLFLINFWVSATLGVMFLCIWVIRAKESVSGWFALTSVFWCTFLWGIFTTETAPFSTTLALANANLVCMLFFEVSCFVFTWRFAGLHHPRLEKALWLFTLMGAVLIFLLPIVIAHAVKVVLFLLYVCAYFVNCVYVIYIAYKKPNVQNLLMAACLAVFIVIVAHDFLVMFAASDAKVFWLRYTFPFMLLLMSLVLGVNLSERIKAIEQFNHKLKNKVTEAEHALKNSLSAKHELELKNTKLKERLTLSQELHDGLGGSIVRSIVLLEQTNETISQKKFLSTLKILRDDLRQIIDTESSAEKHIPDSPTAWCAPLRHRFTTVFEEMDIVSTWQIDSGWLTTPTSMQCLTLARVLEEALTNVIKHSRASQVLIKLTQTHHQPKPPTLVLEIIDNGVGFNVVAVKAAGMSVGMRSMQLRMENLYGSLSVDDTHQGTHIIASMPVVSSH